MNQTHLSYRSLIKLSGPDSLKFLNGQTTITLTDELLEQSALYGAFLSAKGKIISDAFFYKINNAYLIDINKEIASFLIHKFNILKLRSDYMCEPSNEDIIISDQPIGENSFLDLRSIDSPIYRCIINHKLHSDPVEFYLNYKYLNILSDCGYEYQTEIFFPTDLNLDLLNGIDYQKGCFVGQEITSRLKRLGKIKNRLCLLHSEIDLPFNGQCVQNNQVIGDIISTFKKQALAVLRIDRLALNQPVIIDTIEATVTLPSEN